METYLYSSLIFISFALIHSITAGNGFKKRVLSSFPSFRRFYRLAFNLFTILYLSFWYLSLPAVSHTFYHFSGFWKALAYFIQTISFLGLMYSVKLSYPMVFMGISQLFADKSTVFYLDEPQNETPLRIHSLYKFVRHPMYFFSILLLISSPEMTNRWAFISILCIAYFYFGSIFEERKLVQRYGQDYIDYQKNVPRLIP